MGKTSWKVKEKYNQKVYGKLYFQMPKEMVQQFRDKCKRDGVSQAQVVREAIEEFLDK